MVKSLVSCFFLTHGVDLQRNILFIPFFRNSRTGQTCRQIFTSDDPNDADSRKGAPFEGFVGIAHHFGGEIPQQAFSSQTGKILQVSYY